VNHYFPSPAAVAAATRLTEKQFQNINLLAEFIDEITEEARMNERKRIFNMSARDVIKLFWEGRKLYRKEEK
jgi:hypothetical protein